MIQDRNTNEVIDDLQWIESERLIYGLRYAGDEKFFYVGATKSAMRRLVSHVTKAKQVSRDHGIDGAGLNLQRHISRNGFSNIQMVVIGKIECHRDERFYEHFAQAYFLMIGHPLVNAGFPMNRDCFERFTQSGGCQWIYPHMESVRDEVVKFNRQHPANGAYAIRRLREKEKLSRVLDFCI